MFKSLNLLIHKTPWWGLLLGGFATLLALVLFAAPFKVIRLSDHAGTPQEKRAVQHEINQAFKDGGLSVAEGIVHAMKERAQDPDRKRELDRALAEIERARNEVSSAEQEAAKTVHEAAIEALNAAQEAAQVAVEAAQEARETIEESRDEALQKLRAKGLDVSATEKSFEDLLRGAKEKEAAAQVALDGIAKSRERLQQSAPAQPQEPKVDITINSPPAHFKIEATPSLPVEPLPPQLRDNIRAAVAGDMWRAGIGSALILAFIPLFVMLLIAKFFIDRSHRALAFAQRKGEEAQVSDMRRQMTEARLQALQAQVEPHFLYNTLANVQALTEVDPPAANRLVGHLIEYLRAALPKMRESSSTVGQELERVRAYLNILKIRMGERLNFDIHVADDLLALPFPPMMLPSLVENAIKHGLEPQRHGGRIDVLVTRSLHDGEARLVLQVRDTGAGLSQRPTDSGGGLGLSNLRERLTALYGEQGRLSLEANEPQGAVATLDIPLDWRASQSAQPAAQTMDAGNAASGPLPRGWRRVWGVTRKTHGLWATLVARTFMALMSLLIVVFFVGLVALLAGWLPVQINDFQLSGVEGMAVGSIGLLVAFGALALVIAIMVVILYGMGFLFASLLLFVPAVVLISLFPVLSPFILIGLLVYWFWWKKRKTRRMPDLKNHH